MTLPSVSLAASTSFEFKPLVNKSRFSKTLLASALALSFMGTGFNSVQAATSAMPDAAKLAAGVEQKVIDWRRDLHQHPELSPVCTSNPKDFRCFSIILLVRNSRLDNSGC